MPDLPPYVEAKDDIRAHARVRGQEVRRHRPRLAWDPVHLTWHTDMGAHLG
jgi:hypothetical protein